MKFFGGMGCGPRKYPLDFGGNQYHNPDPVYSDPDPKFLKEFLIYYCNYYCKILGRGLNCTVLLKYANCT